MNKKWISFFQLFLPVFLGSLVGFLLSGKIDYPELVKPPLSPPGIVFPIVWTILYLLMGISYYLFRKEENFGTTSLIYYAQLGVNLLWSIVFFLFQWRLFSVFWILLLDFLVGWLLLLFYQKKKVSSYLLIPYFLWILFATYLTIGIYLLN